MQREAKKATASLYRVVASEAAFRLSLTLSSSSFFCRIKAKRRRLTD